MRVKLVLFSTITLPISSFKSNKIDQRTGKIIRGIMPEEPLLCVGTSPYQFQTDYIRNLNPLDHYQLIVPNPCSKKLGKKSSVAHLPDVPDDMWSAHTKDNTGERIHLVIEFDDKLINADLLHFSESFFRL